MIWATIVDAIREALPKDRPLLITGIADAFGIEEQTVARHWRSDRRIRGERLNPRITLSEETWEAMISALREAPTTDRAQLMNAFIEGFGVSRSAVERRWMVDRTLREENMPAPALIPQDVWRSMMTALREADKKDRKTLIEAFALGFDCSIEAVELRWTTYRRVEGEPIQEMNYLSDETWNSIMAVLRDATKAEQAVLIPALAKAFGASEGAVKEHWVSDRRERGAPVRQVRRLPDEVWQSMMAALREAPEELQPELIKSFARGFEVGKSTIIRHWQADRAAGGQ
jgi:predicted secreted protein